MNVADIEANLLLYADFEEVASVSRANLFITAAKRWLILRAESASNQGSSLSLGKSFVESMMKRAQDYVAGNANAGSGGNARVRFLGIGGSFR